MNHNTNLTFVRGVHSQRRTAGWSRGRSSCLQNAGVQGASFQCQHCHYHVVTEAFFSGVQNRNHCPYCLWSKHVDLYRAGDRMAACKATMQPVGLTFKKTPKKYGSDSGELMLIHRCTDCGAISINRLAADDDPEHLLGLITRPGNIDEQLQELLSENGIKPLGEEDAHLVRVRLYGQGLYAQKLVEILRPHFECLPTEEQFTAAG